MQIPLLEMSEARVQKNLQKLTLNAIIDFIKGRLVFELDLMRDYLSNAS